MRDYDYIPQHGTYGTPTPKGDLSFQLALCIQSTLFILEEEATTVPRATMAVWRRATVWLRK
jgi:hypothetical protein